ncbi:hypothetical protein QCA50_006458 [Cerrena zonata]|uniref:Probable RNA polymerase II nuclear localization protein SLC7A6OS n=1 Tax=Cerrena zonata TaxID=2478898 RepID=A0AAW0GDP1_9APHY
MSSITQTQHDPKESYTILRIKRKRNEEPLDALVVDHGPKKKRSKGGINVFQFAETVEADAWKDERQKTDLQKRIATLARENTKKESEPVETTSGSATPAEAAPSPLPSQISQSRSYTVIPSESSEIQKQPTPSKRTATSPPKILSKEEYDEQQRSFTVYEAVPSSTSLASAPSRDMDLEMAKFLPMLEEYLKVSDSVPSLPPDNSTGAEASNDDDYVWDVFYSRPASHKELFDQLNVGLVSGLPQSASGYLDSDSDDDLDEEEDEDSNAEDFYKNDYPDEESASDWGSEKGSDDSDAFHEHSDHDSAYQRDDDDLDWR